jgi:DNA-directed RNA polymerase subunit H (RpoH/RPB5)
MTDEQRDDLLIRLDERMKSIHEWIPSHEKLHTEQKASIQKWLGILVTGLIGVVTKMIIWK